MLSRTISHYKILERLGGGGMGVVYKAEDTKLKRIVALKFLPTSFSFDEEAKQRFMHEAQAASSLQHNNICNIHDIDEEEDGQIFIIMDCYEGEILKKKIEKGPLQISDVIEFAIQITQGLAKAHEKGIVHRDIKPANIFITNDGGVKILDFGLAKLAGQTVITKMGATLGTVAYMSPEQAQGKEIDYTTDIWSLGVVLYEMITGHLPFKGESDNVILYSILNTQPESIQELRNDIPFQLEQIIKRCLGKDKECRYQQIEELLSDLKRVNGETSRGLFTYGDLKKTKARVGIDIRRKGTKFYVLWGSGIFLFMVALLVIIILSSGSNVQLNPKRTTRTLNLPFKEIMYPSISADGNWIAFPAVDVNRNWNIYLTHSSSEESPISLANEMKQFIWSAEISPDGSHVMYITAYPHSVKIIPSLGGIPLILDSLKVISYDQWRPDGIRIGGSKLYLDPEKYEFWTSSLEGTDLRREFASVSREKLFRNFDFAWSPNGKYIARIGDFDEGRGYQEIYICELKTGKEKQITFSKSNIEALCWSSNNLIIYSSTISGPLNLWMVPAEGGEPKQITFGDGPDGPPRVSMDCRKIIYPKMKMMGQIMTIPISGGEPKLVTAGEQTLWWPGAKLSANGSKVAVNVGDLRFGWAGVKSHLYIMNRDGSDRRRIKAGEWEYVDSQSWSPDGNWLAFISTRLFDRINVVDVYILNAGGNNQPKKISRFEKFEDLIWNDSLNLSIKTKDKFYTYSIIQDKIIEDTVLYYAIKGRTDVLMQDLSGNWWIMKNDKKNKIEKPDNTHLSLRNLCWTQWEEGQPFRTISLIDGKVKEYSNLIGPKLLTIYNLSDNGKEIIFSTREFSGQISMIENPFLE